MTVVGCLRVKNEARWVKRVIASILPVCDVVLVMDDHSTDDTALICDAMPRTAVYLSPFDDLNEARDKNWLLTAAMKRPENPDWILWIDGDEILAPEFVDVIKANLRSPKMCMSFRIKYLWNDEHTIRTDGVYGDYRRQSMFRPIAGAKFLGSAPGFHTGNVPLSLWGSCLYPEVTLLHLGYLHREDRIRKYRWYNEQDSNNEREDCYRHVVQGDLPESPAEAKLTHGGPLRLEPLVLPSRHEGMAIPPVLPRR